MTRPDIILSLYRASAELRKAQEAALREGRRDLADAIFDEGVRVSKLIGKCCTGRVVEVQS